MPVSCLPPEMRGFGPPFTPPPPPPWLRERVGSSPAYPPLGLPVVAPGIEVALHEVGFDGLREFAHVAETALADGVPG